jgi:predicted ATPase
MLTHVEIENFRALRSVNVPLRPLTILIGRNDSGKSAFLAALQHLINEVNFQPWDHWQHDAQVKVSLSGTTGHGTTTFSTPGGVGANRAVLPTLRPLGFFHLFSQGVPMESSGYSDEEGMPPPIGTGGDGVSAFFDYLLRRDRERFFAAVEVLRILIPGLKDLEVGTPHPANRRLDLVIENGMRMPANMASAGDRLLLVFVALAYHPSPPKVILLEEPETGIHPSRLAEVIGLLREITESKHCGHSAQVIVTTHSPYVLDLVNPEKDQVLVFRRQEDGSCTAEPADTERLKIFLDEFKLGEVWYNQGEDGLVARRP